MITRKHTQSGDLYYQGTITVDDVILHLRFFPNEPTGQPRLMIDGREAATTEARNLIVQPAKRMTQRERMADLAKIMARQAEEYKP